MRPGPTPFVNKMKRVKCLPVSSELSEKLSENSQAAEDLILDKGTQSVPLSGSVCLEAPLPPFQAECWSPVKGLLLNPGFLKTL